MFLFFSLFGDIGFDMIAIEGLTISLQSSSNYIGTHSASNPMAISCFQYWRNRPVPWYKFCILLPGTKITLCVTLTANTIHKYAVVDQFEHAHRLTSTRKCISHLFFEVASDLLAPFLWNRVNGLLLGFFVCFQTFSHTIWKRAWISFFMSTTLH